MSQPNKHTTHTHTKTAKQKQQRSGAGVGLHPAQAAAHALQALLRRQGVGEASGVGAALLRQRAGESGERRGLPAGRQHRQSYGVGSASSTTATYTDVLALADVKNLKGSGEETKTL